MLRTQKLATVPNVGITTLVKELNTVVYTKDSYAHERITKGTNG